MKLIGKLNIVIARDKKGARILLKKLIPIILLIVAFLIGCGEGPVKDDNASAGNTSSEVNEDSLTESDSEVEHEASIENKENEIGNFVKDYNNLANLSDSIGSLNEKAEIDQTGAQVLYSSSDYGVIALYDGDYIDGYSVVIARNEPYEKLEGDAFNATLNVASVLDIGQGKLKNELEKSLSKEFHSYFEDDYLIAFFNHKLSGQSEYGMVVEFSLKE